MAARGKPKAQEPPEDLRWVFEWDGEVYREDDLTLGEAERIEQRSGTSWLFLNPLRSAVQASAVITVMVAARTGRDEDEVAAEIAASKPDQFLQSYKRVPPDTPTAYSDGDPTPAVAPSTGSSRGTATRRGAGRRQ